VPFVRARNFRGGRTAPVRLVVLHTIEIVEIAAAAERCAAYFASVTKPQVSAHYCVDSDSVVQCVPEADTAFTAPGANHDGVHIEMAGYARQTAAEWADPYSVAMLDRTALLVADICKRHDLPAQLVDESGLLGGTKGITTHAFVSRAFKRSNHTDPGPSFPMEKFLQAVRIAMGADPHDPHEAFTPEEKVTVLGFTSVRAFQAAHPPLAVDGIIGPRTLAAIQAAWAAR
jgi:N-acetyl-anhydromuramyl-L-alanine amidase AmpD